MINIEAVMIENQAQLTVEIQGQYWLATIRDEMGEVVDAHAKNLFDLLANLELNCIEWLEENS